LCTVCRRLDLWELLRRPAYPPEYAILGFYPEIREKAAYCRFCRLVVTTITTGWKSTMELDWDACSNLEETECALDHKLWVMTQPLPPEALKAKIDSGIIEKCSLDVLGEDGVSKGMHDSEIFHPRLVEGDVANEYMLKRWMDICVDYHGDTCGAEIKNNTLRIPKCVRVIDIEAMRLVPAASRSLFSPKIRQYVALSYVWGAVGSKDYETTQANYQQRLRRGGLSDVNFPRTILDAIETTRRLGARYLWIDAVCIIQDSDDDKKDQIGNMNIVYGAAHFTIVAAGSDDARGPIPRSHKGSPHTVQQNVVEINGVRVALPLPTLWDLEWTPSLAPKWFERGWTYQERHLSVRIFVFTTHQVLFQC
ncbi:HET-domain-containing protein, partial [Ascodesmis nigricans]